MTIKFHSNDNLSLNKTIEIPIVTITIRAVFLENKYYPHVFVYTNVYIKYENDIL